MVASVVFLAALTAAGVYFWVLPSAASSKYISTVTSPLATQQDKMKAAFAAFAAPAFASSTPTTPASDDKDFAAADTAISDAQQANQTLKNANAFSPLPGTNLFGPGKSTNQKFNTMSGYVKDSDAFLSEFRTLVTYARQSDKIMASELPGVMASLQAVSASKTLQQLHDTTLAASQKLSVLIADLKGLEPPSDLKDYNNKIIHDLSDINSGLTGIVSAINLKNGTLLQSSAAQTSQAGLKLQADASATDVADKLQHNSALHTDIVNLKAAKPLGN